MRLIAKGRLTQSRFQLLDTTLYKRNTRGLQMWKIRAWLNGP
nr:MAG TPA: hypothetical protein [Caudoviricetes sp.]